MRSHGTGKEFIIGAIPAYTDDFIFDINNFAKRNNFVLKKGIIIRDSALLFFLFFPGAAARRGCQSPIEKAFHSLDKIFITAGAANLRFPPIPSSSLETSCDDCHM